MLGRVLRDLCVKSTPSFVTPRNITSTLADDRIVTACMRQMSSEMRAVLFKLRKAFLRRYAMQLSTPAAAAMASELCDAKAIYKRYFEPLLTSPPPPVTPFERVTRLGRAEPDGAKPDLRISARSLLLFRNLNASTVARAVAEPNEADVTTVVQKLEAFRKYADGSDRFPMKLLLLRIPKNEQLTTLYSAEFIGSYLGAVGDGSVMHGALQIGPYIFNWTTDALVVPQPMVAVDRSLIQYTFAAIPLESSDWHLAPTPDNFLTIAKVIAEWNVHNQHSGELKKEDRENCHGFVRAMLLALMPSDDLRSKSWLLSGPVCASPSASQLHTDGLDLFDLSRAIYRALCRATATRYTNTWRACGRTRAGSGV